MVYFWYVRGSINISVTYLWHNKIKYVLGTSFVCFWYVTDMFRLCQILYVHGSLLVCLRYGRHTQNIIFDMRLTYVLGTSKAVCFGYLFGI